MSEKCPLRPVFSKLSPWSLKWLAVALAAASRLEAKCATLSNHTCSPLAPATPCTVTSVTPLIESFRVLPSLAKLIAAGRAGRRCATSGAKRESGPPACAVKIFSSAARWASLARSSTYEPIVHLPSVMIPGVKMTVTALRPERSVLPYLPDLIWKATTTSQWPSVGFEPFTSKQGHSSSQLQDSKYSPSNCQLSLMTSPSDLLVSSQARNISATAPP